MRLKFALTCALVFAVFVLCSQQVNNPANLDHIARLIPDTAEKTPETLAAYFLSKGKNQYELARLIYVWIAVNIAYDVEGMYTTNVTNNLKGLVDQTFSRKRAVCQGYAELFRDLCSRTGIESYVIHGYTRQNGEVAKLPHAWIVAIIDKKWVFFDPTWAAGYVEHKRFVRRFTDEYFMVAPARNILTHMPYDPIWQCLSHPYSSTDFYNGKRSKSSDTTFFSFPDSIHLYVSLPKNEQEIATLRRVERNGIVNNTLSEYARYLYKNIEVFNLNREIDERNREVERQRVIYQKFNLAVNHYNEAVNLFSDYLDYFNHQFTPTIPDSAIWERVDTCDRELFTARSLLNSLKEPDENLEKPIGALFESMVDLQTKIQEQKIWLNKYLATPKKNRNRLFRMQMN